MATALLDTDTGEITDLPKGKTNFVAVGEGDKVITKAQSEGCKKQIQNEKERRRFVRECGNFIFRFHGEDCMETYDMISDSDMARLAYVATFTDYDGILKFDNGKPIDKKELFEIVKVKKSVFYEWYNLMIASNLLIEVDKNILINNKFYIKGIITSKKTEHTRVFISAVRKLYESNIGKNMITIGRLFKLVPYMHVEHNVLCWNPKDMENEDIEFMTLKEVAKLMGFDEDRISDCIKVLAKYTIDEQQLFRFNTDGIKRADDYVMINPRLFYKGSIKTYKKTCDFFDFYAQKKLKQKKKSIKALQ